MELWGLSANHQITVCHGRLSRGSDHSTWCSSLNDGRSVNNIIGNQRSWRSVDRVMCAPWYCTFFFHSFVWPVGAVKAIKSVTDAGVCLLHEWLDVLVDCPVLRRHAFCQPNALTLRQRVGNSWRGLLIKERRCGWGMEAWYVRSEKCSGTCPAKDVRFNLGTNTLDYPGH